MTDLNWRELYLDKDPLRSIEPSLLSSDEIYQYAKLGCLVSKFDEKKLLPAGYQMQLLGDLIYWKEAEDDSTPLQQECIKIKKGDHVKLAGNSISYLFMAEEFRLPQYIAARFNLRITNVHQGLLLGTGPLVDPGFEGRLLVPLHNLTDNTYLLKGGESLIHVEFTKLAALRRWDPKESAPYSDHYKEFKREKINKQPGYYFGKAQVTACGGVVSNLQSAMVEFQDLNKKAEIYVSRLRNFGIGAAIVLVIAIAALIMATLSVWDDVHSTANRASSLLQETRAMMEEDTLSRSTQLNRGEPSSISPEPEPERISTSAAESD